MLKNSRIRQPSRAAGGRIEMGDEVEDKMRRFGNDWQMTEGRTVVSCELMTS
jgi:hypothetical protein